MSKLSWLAALVVISLGQTIHDPPVRPGRVVDSRTQIPVSDATVAVEGIHTMIRTDSAGRFFLRSDLIGRITLRARRVGYYPARGMVDLGPGQTIIEVGLDPVMICLDYCPSEPAPTNGYVRLLPRPTTR